MFLSFVYLQPLHAADLVFDSILQGGQDPQLLVDLYLHLCDSSIEILGQLVVVLVATWWEKCGGVWMWK